MSRAYVSGKLHRLAVTALEPHYNGSCLIDPALMEAAGIQPFEKVEIYGLNSRSRITTYVFPGAGSGEFKLNGGAALHFELGDEVVVVTYRWEDHFSGAACVIIDPSDNSIAEVLQYQANGSVVGVGP